MKKIITKSLLLTTISFGSFMNLMAAETARTNAEKSKEVSRQEVRSTAELFYGFSEDLIKNIGILMKAESEGNTSVSQAETIGQIQLLSDSIHQIIKCTIHAPGDEAKECFNYLTRLKKMGDQELGEGFMEMIMNPPQQPEDPNPIVEASHKTSSSKSHDPLMSLGPEI